MSTERSSSSSSPHERNGNQSRSPKPRPLPDGSVQAELAALANLGPKSAQALIGAGITSVAQLRSLGSVVAYAKVKQHEPKVTLNLLWALEGALSSQAWQTVAKEHRTSLLLALEQYQNGG